MSSVLWCGIYGLALFTLGTVLSVRASTLPASGLRRGLLFLAGFGFLHGIYEWTKLAGAGDDFALSAAMRLIWGAASFAPLLYFALLTLAWPIRRVHALVAGAAGAWVLIALVFRDHPVAVETMLRVVLGAPVGACAAYAMLRGAGFDSLRAVDAVGVRWLAGVFAMFAVTQLLNGNDPYAIVLHIVTAVAALAVVTKMIGRFSDALNKELRDKAELSDGSLRAILEAEPECVKVIDADGNLLDMNPAGLAMIGACSIEMMRGESVFGLIKPQYHELYRSTLAATLAGQSTSIQFEIVGLNGVHRWMEQVAAPLPTPGDAGNTQRAVAITRDITARIEAERVLAKNQRSLERAQQVVSLGSWEWDIVTNGLAWSDEIYRIFGLTPQQFDASYPAFLERVHPDDRASVEEAVRRAVEEKTAYDIRHRVIRPNGEVRMVREQGEVEYSPTGEPLRMLGAVHDITDYHEVEDRLRVSQARLTGILTIAPEAVVVTDAKGTITMFSSGAEEIFGYLAAEVVGRNVACLMPERYHARHGDYVASFLNTPRPSRRMGERQEILGRRKNGEEFPALASISRLITLEGIALTTILRDISAEKAASRELKEAKERAELARAIADEAVVRLEEAQRVANIGSWEWRADSNVLNCSEQTLRIVGRSREELRALPDFVEAICHPSDLPAVRDAIKASMTTGAPYDAHHRIVRASGEERFIHSQAQVELDEAGRVRRFVGVMRDLTELRSMQELLEAVKAAGEKARAESAAKTDFLSSMSHELRTPLNAIIGYSELMVEDAEESGRKSDVSDHERVIGAAKHLLKLINGLLDLSKIEAGRMEAEIRDFEVAPMAATALDTVRHTAEANGNRLVLELDPDIGAARGDSFRLSQCLLNLLSNASKFTKDGVITLRGRRDLDRNWLVFQVEDTGIGMSKQQFERLFEPFEQADASTARTYGGTGLGLVITKRLAQLLGGDVSVRSAPGEGSIFTLRVRANLADGKQGPKRAQIEVPSDGAGDEAALARAV